jgi:predicted transcriptional regulator
MRWFWRRNLGTVDLDTGDILQGVPVYFNATVRWREDWFMAIQDAFEALSKDKELYGRTRAVLDFMMSKLSWENWVHVEQKQIVEELDLHKSDVSRAIRLLVEKGIILRAPLPRNKRMYAYKLNSNYGYKGKVKNLSIYRLKEARLLRSERDLSHHELSTLGLSQVEEPPESPRIPTE